MKLGKNENELSDDFLYGFGGESAGAEKEGADFLGTFVSPGKFRLLIAIVIFGLLLICAKAVFLQIFRGSYYVGLAESNRAKIEFLRPSRGIIYDLNKRPLVNNKPLFEAAIIPASLPFIEAERISKINEISTFISADPAEITGILDKYSKDLKQPISVKEGIDYETALNYLTRSNNYPSLVLSISPQRDYYDATSFAHILGYTGKITADELKQVDRDQYLFSDSIGKSGLELSYEAQLRGSLGYREYEVDAQGHEKKVLSEKPAVNGSGIRLSIDQDLQDFISKKLEQQLHSIGKSKGVVVALDPRSGKVRAMVSFPSYDNNLFAQGITQEQYDQYTKNPDNPLFNRAIKGNYPSGSTVKIVVGAAALEEGVVNEQTSILSTGGIWYDKTWFFPDWKAGGHGQTNIYKAIADSVNTYFYMVGGGYKDFNGLGLDRLVKYYKAFGLGEVTGIDLPHEASGLVPTREWKEKVKNEEWYIGDTYHVSIGQGDLLVTPLQVAQYTTAFANGGVIYKPSLVEALVDPDGHESKVEPKISKEKMVDDYTINVIKKAMRRGVTQGSSKYLNSLTVEVAGKTGTAQIGENKLPEAWWTGFAPYDKPTLVLTILIEEGGEGSSVAVPLAYQIFQYYSGEYNKSLPQ